MNLSGRGRFYKAMSVRDQWAYKEPEKPRKGAPAKDLKKYEKDHKEWKQKRDEAIAKHDAEVRASEERRRQEDRERENRIEYEAPGVGRRWINDGRGGYYVYFRHDDYDGGR